MITLWPLLFKVELLIYEPDFQKEKQFIGMVVTERI